MNNNNINEDPEYIQDKIEFTAQEDTKGFIGNTNTKVGGALAPPPPKPGEVIHCQICGQAMMPEHFSKNPTIRKREFKWHMHQFCMMQMEDLADRSTPGLLAERKNANK